MYIEDTEVTGRNTEVESIPVNRIRLLKISIRVGHIGIRHRSLVRQAYHLHVGMRLQLADDTHEILSRPLASLFVGNIGSAGGRTHGQRHLIDILKRVSHRLRLCDPAHRHPVDGVPEQYEDDKQFYKHPGIAAALCLDQFQYM